MMVGYQFSINLHNCLFGGHLLDQDAEPPCPPPCASDHSTAGQRGPACRDENSSKGQEEYSFVRMIQRHSFLFALRFMNMRDDVSFPSCKRIAHSITNGPPQPRMPGQRILPSDGHRRPWVEHSHAIYHDRHEELEKL